jgi:hypothetical protein
MVSENGTTWKEIIQDTVFAGVEAKTSSTNAQLYSHLYMYVLQVSGIQPVYSINQSINFGVMTPYGALPSLG